MAKKVSRSHKKHIRRVHRHTVPSLFLCHDCGRSLGRQCKIDLCANCLSSMMMNSLSQV